MIGLVGLVRALKVGHPTSSNSQGYEPLAARAAAATKRVNLGFHQMLKYEPPKPKTGYIAKFNTSPRKSDGMWENILLSSWGCETFGLVQLPGCSCREPEKMVVSTGWWTKSLPWETCLEITIYIHPSIFPKLVVEFQVLFKLVATCSRSEGWLLFVTSYTPEN